mmetsp:Transcript_38741/g.115790  ORF Transcript_38741/g.115790 Transcript_38741/m.115790 type:complete len:240 (+) Transcript_38741:649-1368(+)
MLMTKKTCCTAGPMRSSSQTICSSSPSPSPVRLSPLWKMPCSSHSRRPKKTASMSFPFLSSKIAETSRSTSSSSAGSQPNPTVILPMPCGRSSTPPFSMAKATFCLLGACGRNMRMVSASKGSMSMKCWPCCAGSSMIRRLQRPPAPLNIAATTSTEAALLSSSNCAISRFSLSSRRRSLPPCTSLRKPPEYAATTKTSAAMLCDSLGRVTQMSSWMPFGFPTTASPECVMPLPAFMLL